MGEIAVGQIENYESRALNMGDFHFHHALLQDCIQDTTVVILSNPNSEEIFP